MQRVQKRYLLIGGVLGLIMLALIVSPGCSSRSAQGAQQNTPDVEVVQVQKKMFQFMRNGLVRSMDW
jgi:hypothetical protein